MSIKWKIVALVLSINFLAIIIGFSIIIYSTNKGLHENIVDKYSAITTSLTSECVVPIKLQRTDIIETYLPELASFEQIVAVVLKSPDGKILEMYSNDNDFSFLEDTIKEGFYFHSAYLHIIQKIKHKDSFLGELHFRISTDQLEKQIFDNTITLFAIMLGVVIIVFFLASFLQKFISRPILELANAASNFSTNNDYSTFLKTKRQDEIGVLKKSFGQMLEQLKKREVERDLALNDLQESEERFKKISSSANDAIVVMNEHGKVIFWNLAAEKIFGYSSNEILNHDLHSYIASPEARQEFLTAFENYKKTGEGTIVGKSVEMEGVKKNGNIFPVEISVAATLIKNKWHSIGIIKDISERKEAERNLRQAKKRAEESDMLKSSFLANMSHEIRTPMNAIIGFTDLLRRPGVSEEKRNQFIKIIHKNNNILLKLIDDILDISKIEANQLTLKNLDFNASDLVNELFQVFDEERKSKELYLVDFVAQQPEHSINVHLNSDKMRVHQVLANFLSNAFKFTSKGFIELGFFVDENSFVVFYVKDTGIGIPTSEQENIFNRFRQVDSSNTRRYGGTGLGLAISKGIADLLGGEIWLDSTVDAGSTFYLKLPCFMRNVEYKTKVIEFKASAKYNWKNKTILIVEDEESNYELLREALEETGVNILWAKDGIPAVQMCTDNENIDLVLMDIQMPQLNGLDATKQIKKIRKNLPIIAQTAYAMPNEKEKSFEAGCCDYIPKPINISLMLSKIDLQLNQNS